MLRAIGRSEQRLKSRLSQERTEIGIGAHLRELRIADLDGRFAHLESIVAASRGDERAREVVSEKWVFAHERACCVVDQNKIR